MIPDADLQVLKLHLASYLSDIDEVDMFIYYFQNYPTIQSALYRFIDLPSLTQQLNFLDDIKKEIKLLLN